MPVSTLRCTRTPPGRPPPALRRAEAREGGDALDLPGVVHHRREVVGEELLDPVAAQPVEAAHDEDRRADARLAQLDGLLEQGHAHPRDARALQRARHRGRAVPVRVGLEHAPDLRARRHRAGWAGGPHRTRSSDAQVVAEVGEVHLGARGPDGVGGRGAAGAEDTYGRPRIVGEGHGGGCARAERHWSSVIPTPQGGPRFLGPRRLRRWCGAWRVARRARGRGR